MDTFISEKTNVNFELLQILVKYSLWPQFRPWLPLLLNDGPAWREATILREGVVGFVDNSAASANGPGKHGHSESEALSSSASDE
jgi:hypothetical protein